jgi:hypothetical protein
VNDSPELAAFSWEVTTTPVESAVLDRPTSHLTIDSTAVDPADLAALEDILYGDSGSDPRLPTPDEVADLFDGAVTVNLNLSANQPTFVNGTGVVTLPSVTGVQWKVNGVNKAPGAQPAITVGQTSEVDAVATSGYTVSGDSSFSFERV